MTHSTVNSFKYINCLFHSNNKILTQHSLIVIGTISTQYIPKSKHVGALVVYVCACVRVCAHVCVL